VVRKNGKPVHHREKNNRQSFLLIIAGILTAFLIIAVVSKVSERKTEDLAGGATSISKDSEEVENIADLMRQGWNLQWIASANGAAIVPGVTSDDSAYLNNDREKYWAGVELGLLRATKEVHGAGASGTDTGNSRTAARYFISWGLKGTIPLWESLLRQYYTDLGDSEATLNRIVNEIRQEEDFLVQKWNLPNKPGIGILIDISAFRGFRTGVVGEIEMVETPTGLEEVTGRVPVPTEGITDSDWLAPFAWGDRHITRSLVTRGGEGDSFVFFEDGRFTFRQLGYKCCPPSFRLVNSNGVQTIQELTSVGDFSEVPSTWEVTRTMSLKEFIERVQRQSETNQDITRFDLADVLGDWNGEVTSQESRTLQDAIRESPDGHIWVVLRGDGTMAGGSFLNVAVESYNSGQSNVLRRYQPGSPQPTLEQAYAAVSSKSSVGILQFDPRQNRVIGVYNTQGILRYSP